MTTSQKRAVLPFLAKIHSDSPITTFTQADLRVLLKVDVIFAKPMPKQEQNLDDNNRPLTLLGFTTVDVKVGRRIIKKPELSLRETANVL